MSTAPNPDDPGSTGDPTDPDAGTGDKVAGGSRARARSKSKSKRSDNHPSQAQHDKEIRRAQSLGIVDADKLSRDELQAELGKPEYFSSLLDRDTTHFDNIHYGQIDNKQLINGSSSGSRQLAAQAALEALGGNVTAGTAWDDSEPAVVAFQEDHDLEPTGSIDRATWDAIGDELFPS